MKRIFFSVLTLLVSAMANAASESVDLRSLHHIKFDKIDANEVMLSGDELRISVDSSASFMMLGFEEVQTVTGVNLLWRSEGQPALRDAEHERSKDGDDAVLKMALLLEGEYRGIDWFLPDWIEEARSRMHHESDELFYVVAASSNAPGENWGNPYNDNILMMPMQQSSAAEGRTLSSLRFDEPLRVVGIWLMADGDNTGSSFETFVYDISFDNALKED